MVFLFQSIPARKIFIFFLEIFTRNEPPTGQNLKLFDNTRPGAGHPVLKEGNALAAKYLIIARELEHQLNRSQGEKLPTEAALCRQFGVSRQTVRSALAVLEEKGLIFRRQGSGSYPTQTAPNTQIAVVLGDKEEYLAPALLRDIRKAAAEAGFTVTCMETGLNRQREGEILETLLRQRPTGILLEPITDVLGCLQEELLRRLAGSGIPLVYLNGRYGVQAPAVLREEERGAELLLAHLSFTGHRRVAAILKWDDSQGLRRFRGLCQGAKALDIRFDERSCLWYSQQDRLALLNGDEELLRRFQTRFRGDCSAVVCFNDELAYRLQRYLRASHAPMSIVSFDNSYLAIAQDASLTTLGPAEETPGAAAVRLLLNRLEGREAEDILLPWRLYPRKSG